jgi:hypothetical protein
MGRLVAYVYPRTGTPGEPSPIGWNDIPGARSLRIVTMNWPAVSVEAKKVRTRKMIRELRTLGYRIELISPAPVA